MNSFGDDPNYYNTFSQDIVLLDIEGTTTSISFVKDVLFPYIRDNLSDYLDQHWNDEEFKTVLSLLKNQSIEDEKNFVSGVVSIVDNNKESIIKNVLWQMDNDRKTSSLKLLQGHIWRFGYQSDKIKGHLYEDVLPCLTAWRNAGKRLYIYSSGSIEAQKLLFENTTKGNILHLFSGHFDTTVGTKVESTSYAKIAALLSSEPNNIIFLTDVYKEAVAAKNAGFEVCLVERPGNTPLLAEHKSKFTVVSSFNQLALKS